MVDRRQSLMGAVRLWDEWVIPATVVAAGQLGRFTRVTGPIRADGWALCQGHCAEGGLRDQPLVATIFPMMHRLAGGWLSHSYWRRVTDEAASGWCAR